MVQSQCGLYSKFLWTTTRHSERGSFLGYLFRRSGVILFSNLPSVISLLQAPNYALFISHRHPDSHVSKKRGFLSVILTLINRRISTFSLPREKANHGGPFQLTLLDTPVRVTRSPTPKNTTTPPRSPTPTSHTKRFFLVVSGLNLTVWNRRQQNEERRTLIFNVTYV